MGDCHSFSRILIHASPCWVSRSSRTGELSISPGSGFRRRHAHVVFTSLAEANSLAGVAGRWRSFVLKLKAETVSGLVSHRSGTWPVPRHGNASGMSALSASEHADREAFSSAMSMTCFVGEAHIHMSTRTPAIVGEVFVTEQRAIREIAVEPGDHAELLSNCCRPGGNA